MAKNKEATAAVPEGTNVKVVKPQKPKTHTALTKFTYLLALLCLIAGLALPIGLKFDDYLNHTLFWQLPAAINIIFGKEVLTFGASVFELSLPASPFGFGFDNGGLFDLGAYLVVLYAVAAVIAVLWLFLVLFSKKQDSCLAKASFAEGLALLVLLPLIEILLVSSLNAIGTENLFLHYLPLYIAAGGTLLMVLVQAFAYKKSSGFMKFIMLIFSALAFLLISGYLSTLSFLESPMQSLSDLLGGKFTAFGLIDTYYGFDLYFLMLFSIPSSIPSLFEGMELIPLIAMYCALATVILVVINVILDILGLAKKTKKGMLGFNIFRYLLTVLAAGGTIGLAIWQNITIGLPLLFIAVLALIQLIVNIARSASFKKRAKAERERLRKQQKIERQQQLYGRAPSKGYSSDAAAANAYLQGADERREKAQADREERRKQRQEQRDKAKAEKEALLAAENAKEQPQESYYNVTQIYKGPTDEFIKELTNDEKIEFAKVFLERRDVISEIPEYIIGGNNEKFFSSIFIHYGRMSDLVSSALMGKIYDCGYRKCNA